MFSLICDNFFFLNKTSKIRVALQTVNVSYNTKAAVISICNKEINACEKITTKTSVISNIRTIFIKNIKES